jgi:hypothetical protein
VYIYSAKAHGNEPIQLAIGNRFCLVKKYARSVGQTIRNEDRIVVGPVVMDVYGPTRTKKRKDRNY